MSLKKINILSIDVGIKNLACCLLSINQYDKTYTFLKWDVLDLCKEFNNKLICTESNCKRNVNYSSYDKTFYCNIHAKKCKYKIPTKDDKISLINKLKINELKQYCSQRLIFLEESMKKNDIINKIKEYLNKNCLEKVKTDNANKFTLIDIGKNIVSQLNQFLITERVDKVIIENQISPIANRMKTIQGMIAQYFIMKGIYDIEFINASNKLKLFSDKKTNYKERKHLSIQITNDLINKMPENQQYITIHQNNSNVVNSNINDTNNINQKFTKNIIFNKYQNINLKTIFDSHKKKDDLADCFLQAYWYIKEYNLI